jgi:hypothetical protein
LQPKDIIEVKLTKQEEEGWYIRIIHKQKINWAELSASEAGILKADIKWQTGCEVVETDTSIILEFRMISEWELANKGLL